MAENTVPVLQSGQSMLSKQLGYKRGDVVALKRYMVDGSHGPHRKGIQRANVHFP